MKWLIVERLAEKVFEDGIRFQAVPCGDDEMVKKAKDIYDVKSAPSHVVAVENPLYGILSEGKIEEEISGALARGYCSKENEHKNLDATLITAMTLEVKKLIEQI